jgi:hypothetical protein
LRVPTLGEEREGWGTRHLVMGIGHKSPFIPRPHPNGGKQYRPNTSEREGQLNSKHGCVSSTVTLLLPQILGMRSDC